MKSGTAGVYVAGPTVGGEAVRTLHQRNENLADEVNNLKHSNESIKSENAELRRRLERLEAVVLQTTSTLTK